MLRQSRGRHLNHGYYIVIQSQLPRFNNFAHFLHINDLFPCFCKFSGFGLVWMMGSQERTLKIRKNYKFNQVGKTKILSHLPNMFSKNPFFCFTVSWGPFLESSDN